MRIPVPRSAPARVVAVTAAVAVATGAAGWFVGARVKSPADAAAAHRPPPASLITVAVQERTLTATVVGQGTVTYGVAQPLALTGAVAAGDAADPPAALITKAPEAGRMLREGDVLMEVSGRPVFVLSGKVPMYRTLTRGSNGDDVRQLREALRRLRPAAKVAASGALDDAALGAVRAWYQKSGYTAAEPTAAQRTQLRTLEQAVRAAAGTTPAATQAAKDAKADLAEFRKTYGTSVASGEIIFLPRLPVRLTTVTAKPGAPATGPIGTVADPTLVVTGDLANEDKDLVKVDMPATLESAAGTFEATLSKLGAGAKQAPPEPAAPPGPGSGASGADDPPAKPAADGGGSGTPFELKPKDPGKLEPLAGQSFKILIKVGDTGVPVLTVPVAALVTRSDGQARVSVQDAGGAVRDVDVTAGLTADGYVQVTPAPAGGLKAGDRVVVGVS